MTDTANHPCLNCGEPAICDGSRYCRQFCSLECADHDRAAFDRMCAELENRQANEE